MILNVLLAGAVLLGTVDNLRRIFSRKADTALLVKKKDRSGKSQKNISASAVQAGSLPSQEEMIKKITENNLFYTGRSPNAHTRNNRRLTLTLVGTFTIGKVSGAIIKHNIQQDNRTNAFGMWRRNAYGMMGQAGNPMMQMGGGNAINMQQRNVDRNRSSTAANTGNNRQSAGGSFRRRFTSGAMAGNNTPLPPGVMPGMFTGMNQSRSTSAQVQRQYVRIGETLSNGYTLVEVTRNTATLMRGSDKMELELQESSKGLSSSRRTVNRPRTSQQILQQGMQQMQNILRQQGMQQNFMMRQMMNRNNNAGQNQRGTPAARRRR